MLEVLFSKRITMTSKTLATWSLVCVFLFADGGNRSSSFQPDWLEASEQPAN